VLLAGVALLAGCNTTDTTAAKKKTADDEYVTVTPSTSSRVPRKVKKSEAATAAQGDNVTTMSGEALKSMQQPGRAADGGNR
jgi:hypothetical protein